MGIVKTNPLLKGLSGRHENMILRTFNNKTFFSRLPSKPLKQSAHQKLNRSKFKMAADFSKEMMKNPERKEYYRKKAKKLKLPNAYTAAIADYMRMMEMTIEVAKESGSDIDYIIRIHVTKKHFDITAVEIIIQDADRNIIEKGAAYIAVRGLWIYNPTDKLLATPGLYCVIATAADATGKTIEKEISWSHPLPH
ncbi:hypothetical protein [Chryseolinea sp. H1M3-3]|uniref:hypothetical protein n=1 Tax=Chryseolinea sp. H1M3-3 TaxID=3034144 RepID=UPI0023EC93B8|nr:hypothetical protein [Chryseolinea sp. H1M3-3]